jgi:hypothetical protein
MILSQTTMIAAPAERVFAFFEEMEANYTSWHPDHITFRWLQEATAGGRQPLLFRGAHPRPACETRHALYEGGARPA